jgi:flagellar biosynthetic protein FlhB
MAEDNDDSQKTEEPSQRKLEEARRKGQVVLSREVNNWFLLAAAGVALLLGPMSAVSVERAARMFLARSHEIRVDYGLLGMVGEAVVDALYALLPAFALGLLAVFAGPVLQRGFVIATERLHPRLDNLSPMAGFKRIFSVRSAVEFGKNLAKIAVVGTVAAVLLLPELDRLPLLPSFDELMLLHEMHALAIRLVAGVLVVLTALAAFDYGYQWFAFRRSMRMTKEEMKEEFKQTEGDPVVKAKLRQIRQARARQRMMAAVPGASVVITNPTHFAVALKYELGARGAPKCVAKGADAVAAKIREVATAHDVPIVENPPLARALYATMDIDEEVPEEHYKAVAEVISYIFRLKGKMRPK